MRSRRQHSRRRKGGGFLDMFRTNPPQQPSTIDILSTINKNHDNYIDSLISYMFINQILPVLLELYTLKMRVTVTINLVHMTVKQPIN